MNSNKLRILSVAAFLFIAPAVSRAQSASQAQQMLQSNPELLNQLRSRIMSSGLTPDQVRERLKAEGIEPGDIKSLADLSKLPVVTKQQLRDEQLAHPPVEVSPDPSVNRPEQAAGARGTRGRHSAR